MMRSVFVLMLAVSGCALMKQGLKESEQGGADPNRQALPEGTGWFCFIASDASWSGCERTQKDCDDTKGRRTKDAMTQGIFNMSFGNCMQAVQAMCITHDEMKTQSDGSAKPEPFYDCMPDQMSCNKLKDVLRQASSNMHVSYCFDAK